MPDVVTGMLSLPKPSDYWTTDPNRCFPELIVAKTTKQRNNQSVFDHTMHVLDALSSKNEVTLLAALSHDLGKTETADSSYSRFPNHAEKSVIIARRRLQLWQSPSETIDSICRIINMHMFDTTLPLPDKTINKFVAKVGPDNIDDWFVLRIADSASYRYRGAYCKRYINPFRVVIDQYLDKLPSTAQFIDKETDTGMQISGK